MNTYYITGITGFLGRNIVKELLAKEKDAEIIGFVLPNDNHRDFSSLNCSPIFIEGNILNEEDVKKFLSTPSQGDKYLIHAAGRISVYKKGDPLTTKINVEGTKIITDLAKSLGFKKMIYVSSVDALNKTKGNEKIFEQARYDETKVDGVYSKSKANAGNYVLDQASDKFEVVIVNPSAIMGPDDPFGAPINIAIKKAIHGKLPAVVKGGYDIVDVRDVAYGIVALLQKGQNKESYLLTGNYTSVKDLMNAASEISNSKKVRLVVPHWLIKCISPFIEISAKLFKKKPLFTGFSMDCLNQNSNYSHQKSEDTFNYNPRSIHDSLIDTIKWMNDTNF